MAVALRVFSSLSFGYLDSPFFKKAMSDSVTAVVETAGSSFAYALGTANKTTTPSNNVDIATVEDKFLST